MLRAILRHHLSELIVHVISDPVGCLLFEFVDRTNNLRLDWARCWERFNDCLALEPHCCFCQNSRVNTASAKPRLSTLFILHAQNVQAFDEHINPVLATGYVTLNVAHDVTGYFLQLTVVHELCKVRVKLFSFALIRHHFNFHAIHSNPYTLWIDNLNLNRSLFVRHIICTHTQWGLR